MRKLARTVLANKMYKLRMKHRGLGYVWHNLSNKGKIKY